MANKDGSKSGGRTKGTPNKTTLDAKAIAERLGVDPFEVLLLIVKADWEALGFEEASRETIFGVVQNITLAQRLKAAAEASKYLYPQRKAVELKVDDEAGPVSITFIEAKK